MTATTSLRLALQRGQTGVFPSDDVSLVLIAEQRPTREALSKLRQEVAENHANRPSEPTPSDADAFLWQMNTETLLSDRTERLLDVIDRAIEVVTHPRLRGGRRSVVSLTCQ
ncbi:hypothetical protein ACI3KX_18365 [Microbacterium sp. ZW CA_36]|uniref:hypothetical protein n=1 Tax=Microbacterium sp. ZW CA_36 TaxID=3378078 RepID=UPI00385222C0